MLDSFVISAPRHVFSQLLVSRFIIVFSVIVCFQVALSANIAFAQSNEQTSNDVSTDTNVELVASPQSGSQASSGGNVFDFSSNGGRNAPPAPNLPSFAGGPCTGPGTGLTASGPGFAIGGGKSFEDEACQRRNWVQTLVGVSQHMPEVEANELKRVAIAIMMQDKYVGPAFEALGYDTSNPGNPQRRPQVANGAQVAPEAAGRRKVEPQPSRAAMVEKCVAIVPVNASQDFKKLVSARGCELRSR